MSCTNDKETLGSSDFGGRNQKFYLGCVKSERPTRHPRGGAKLAVGNSNKSNNNNNNNDK